MTKRPIPFDVGPVHFVGIGGIGMSGIAEIMLTLGYEVQGSDQKDSANTDRLRDKGIAISIGHDPRNLGEAGAIVVSTAVKRDNPEVKEALKRGLPIVRRAEMLAELMRLEFSVAVGGTHGKTTTTSLVASLLDAADLDPTVVNGGIINAYGTNAKVGTGDWIVVEADESDGSFLKLKSTIAIVTNIDPEHLDHYGDFEAIKEAFDDFIGNIPFYGFAVVCTDHPESAALAARTDNRRVITYGTNPQADVRADNVRHANDGTHFDVVWQVRGEPPMTMIDLHLPMAGPHNVLNALAAIAVARELGASNAAIRKGLSGFTGVKRRFTTVGTWNDVRLVDDYGHHPVEIAAVLKAARQVTEGRVVAVVQPHRYSRLQSLFAKFCDCFLDADAVVVTDVYAAGEEPIEGVDRQALVEGIRRWGHRDVRGIAGEAELAPAIAEIAKPGDVVVGLGAGDISQWMGRLPKALEALSAEKAEVEA